MAWVVDPAAALAAIETACHFDGVANVEIYYVMAVLGSLEVSHGACDTHYVEVV